MSGMEKSDVDVTIRRARMEDVRAIMDVTREFGNQGIMIPISLGDATERLREFMLAEENGGGVVGCVAVHVTWDRLVEIRSLAVLAGRQGNRIGARLMEAALDDARQLGADNIFTLTYIPDFFARFGFSVVDRALLPHKVWLDCVKCPKFPDCGETAMRRAL